MLRTVRKAFIILFVLILVVLIGQILWVSLHPKGGVVVFAPADSAARVRIGEETGTVEPGASQVFALSRGSHRIDIQSAESISHELDLEEASDLWVVPAAREQCFEELDVTGSHYGAQSKPHVMQRYARTEPFLISREFYFSESELPATAPDPPQRVYLLRLIPCGPPDTGDDDGH